MIYNDEIRWNDTYQISHVLIYTRLNVIENSIKQNYFYHAEFLLQLTIDDILNYGIMGTTQNRTKVILDYTILAKTMAKERNVKVTNVLKQIKIELEIDKFIARKYFVKNDVSNLPLEIRVKIANYI